jgi:hypothetical protein
VNVTPQVQATLSGGNLQSPVVIGPTQPLNPNAAEPTFVTLAVGNNQIFAPSVASGAIVNGFIAVPVLAGSTNAKTYSGASGGAGFNCTYQPFVGGIAAGGSFWIASAGVERIQIIWF